MIITFRIVSLGEYSGSRSANANTPTMIAQAMNKYNLYVILSSTVQGIEIIQTIMNANVMKNIVNTPTPTPKMWLLEDCTRSTSSVVEEDIAMDVKFQ